MSHFLPQGDAVSTLSLLALVTGLSTKVVAEPAATYFGIYLDDWNFIVRSPGQKFGNCEKIFCATRFVGKPSGYVVVCCGLKNPKMYSFAAVLHKFSPFILFFSSSVELWSNERFVRYPFCWNIIFSA